MVPKFALSVMNRGLFAKFSQNNDMREKLLNTGNCILLEASPHDHFWGIGLSMNDPDIYFFKFLGQNYLGKLLMSIRAQLILEKMHQNNIYFFR